LLCRDEKKAIFCSNPLPSKEKIQQKTRLSPIHRQAGIKQAKMRLNADSEMLRKFRTAQSCLLSGDLTISSQKCTRNQQGERLNSGNMD